MKFFIFDNQTYKQHRMNKILIFLSFIVLISCKNKNTTSVENTETTPSTTEAVAPPVNPFMSLPVFPQEKTQILFEKCDYVSIIFNTYSGQSINLSDPNKAKGMLANLITLRKPENPICGNSFAYVSFIEGKETLAEADIFFQTGCTYLVFRENNQYSSICQMGDKGIQTLNSISQDLYKRAQQNQQNQQNNGN